MRVEHSPLMNEFISFWIETSVDGLHRFDTYIDFLGREWHSCPAGSSSKLIGGTYESSLSEDAAVEFVKTQLNDALSAGRI
jgi:hypothetical protein